jgi:hypothetical protein
MISDYELHMLIQHVYHGTIHVDPSGVKKANLLAALRELKQRRGEALR